MNRLRFTSRVFPVDSLPTEVVETWKRIQGAHHHLHSAFFTYEYACITASVRPYVYVCVIEEDGNIAGLLPFQFETALHRSLGAAERVSGEMSDYFGLIASPSLKVTSQELLHLAGLNHFYFTHLNETQLPHGIEAERPQVGLLIDLTANAGEYWDRLRIQDKKFVQDTERRARKLEADYGPLQFRFEEPDWPGALDHLIEQKRQQYKATNVLDCLAETWRRNLLRGLAMSQSNACRVRLSTLFAGTTWVAAQLSLQGGSTLHNWFPVYNRNLSQYAPGRLLLKAITDAAPNAGVSTIDRGVGDTKAKRDFANREQLFYRGAWHRANLQSLVYRAACSIKWRISDVRRHRPGRVLPAAAELQNA